MLSSFLLNRRGATTVIYSLMAPMLIGLAVTAIDVQRYFSVKANLQAAADAGALSAAAELSLGTADPRAVAQTAQLETAANIKYDPARATIAASILATNDGVHVEIDQDAQSAFGLESVLPVQHIHVLSEARLAGGTVFCLLTLGASTSMDLALDSARVTSPGCAAYSNSTAADGLYADGSAQLQASLVCSGGGVAGNPSAFSPSAVTDCPRLADPLAGRPAPPVGNCDYNNEVVDGGGVNLWPGVYCGGITVQNGANVTLNPGVYVVKDGPFTMNGNSSLTALNAGVYLTGAAAVLNFDPTTTVDLTAAATGPLAGMIFFEDRSAPTGRTHLIASRSAANLLGILYFPQGKLVVGATPNVGPVVFNCNLVLSLLFACPTPRQSVGGMSDWTVVIANQFVINAGINLVMNSNYFSGAVRPPTEVVTPAVHLSR